MTRPTPPAPPTDLPEGYRLTELGPLPEEWRVVRLGEVVKRVKGRKPRTLVEAPLPNSLPYLTADYFRSNQAKKFVPQECLEAVEICEKDDIVLIWDGSNAGQVFTGLNGVLASTMVKLVLENQSIERSFLFLYLITQFESLNSQTTGSTIPHVNKNLFFNLPIPLPPLPEQRAIAHVLRTVQRAKEATERVIAALKELKKSLMRHLFTYGPVPVDQADQVPLKETEIGPLPEEWEVVRLGEVAEKPQYGFTASAVADRVGPKFLRITDIQDARVSWHTVPYCKLDNVQKKKYRLESGDVLFARIGATTGKSFLISECPDAVFASYLIRVRTRRERLLPELLHYVTQRNIYWTQINAAKGGRLKQGINIPVLSGLRIPLPPLPEQRKIAKALRTVDRKIEAEEQRKAALEALFKTLLHHLMTGKVRVKDLQVSEVEERHEPR